MKSRNGYSDSVAKERLKLMVESEPAECSSKLMDQMKQEIAVIVSRYFSLEPENYEIKVILKHNKKRA